MNLEETTQLYASVLRQLLPVGGYDASPNTEALAVDVYAHAKLLAQADLDGKRLLKVLEEFPPELLPEYETEYGLPLKCSINVGRTIEERLEILKWVRNTRNVLNRTYLEQHLAIFGVVLIDIVKFKPLLCTAPCNSPVNTEHLRYKVFLRLQYPMNADMNCIIENYLPGYLRIEWMIDMPWGEWILNPAVTVNTNGIAHYTAYKTNQREYYDSYANLDLTAAIVQSLHDSDMQQWQAVKDAANELTGVTNWVVDNANSQIVYHPVATNPNDPTTKIVWSYNFNKFTTPEQTCSYYGKYYTKDGYSLVFRNGSYVSEDTYDCRFTASYNGQSWNESARMTGSLNPAYNPNSTTPASNVPFNTVAQKIISNASSLNQSISLLAEAYLEAVANSIFNVDPIKQFVKPTDLLSQFELNKTLRT